MKVLVANRGEIAVRIIRACRALGLGTVAVFSECDRSALHVRLADEAWPIGPSPAAESYLRIDKLLEVARRARAAFLHPGYGFLAENAALAEACRENGLTFVGPPAAAIRVMGSKTAARQVAVAAGVPVVPGSAAPFAGDVPEAVLSADAVRLGFPLLVKAVAGGGGKGMRLVTSAAALPAAVRTARSEAAAAFGEPAVYFERLLTDPRHIEVQLLADGHGRVVPFVERDCSIQRRHQKVVEESPAPGLEASTRTRMAEAAARIAREVGYANAGTIEFLLDRDGQFYFLEMNTRLQVEHPITEAVTGIDLVGWQLRIAQGDRLAVSGEQAGAAGGHAIECRIYAEDPDAGFLPSPGTIRAMNSPGGPGIREDRGVAPGDDVPVFYDSLLAKLIAWGPDRTEAIHRLRRALGEYRVVGLTTTVPFFRWLVDQPEFQAGGLDTGYLDRVLESRAGVPFMPLDETSSRDAAVVTALAAWFRAHRAAAADTGRGAGWRLAARQDGLR